MFAVMYEIDCVKYFKIYKTYEEAVAKEVKMSDLGYKVTVFDYDKIDDEYIEFYTTPAKLNEN